MAPNLHQIIIEYKLTSLLSGIAILYIEDVKIMFDVVQFPAIYICMLAKMQEILTNTFKDFRTISNSLKPPRRSSNLSTLPSISTQIEARESGKEDGLSNE